MARRGGTLGGIRNGPVSPRAAYANFMGLYRIAATLLPNNLHQTVALSGFDPAGQKGWDT
jgi:hypothetical protein